MAKKLLAKLFILTGSILVSNAIFAPDSNAVPLYPIITFDPSTNQVGVAVGVGVNQSSSDHDHPRYRQQQRRPRYREGYRNPYGNGNYDNGSYNGNGERVQNRRVITTTDSQTTTIESDNYSGRSSNDRYYDN